MDKEHSFNDLNGESVASKTYRYLQQQKEMLGDLLFIEPNRKIMQTEVKIETIQKNTVEEIRPTNISQIKENNKFTMPQRTSDLMTGDTPEWMNAPSLPILYQEIHTCLNCALGTTRTNFVFGTGNPNADIMVIGEAPGADEDAQGKPFVGAAGQLLTKILAAIGIEREEVFIANIIKCRPPNNRRPEKSETEQCEPYLMKQIELIQPKFILAVGLTAANTLLKSENKMGEIRGKPIDFHGTTMIVTYHPAALLRNPSWKQATWDDVQLLQKMYVESKKNTK